MLDYLMVLLLPPLVPGETSAIRALRKGEFRFAQSCFLGLLKENRMGQSEVVAKFVDRVTSLSEADWVRVAGIGPNPQPLQRVVLASLVAAQFALLKSSIRFADTVEQALAEDLWSQLSAKNCSYIARVKIAHAMLGLQHLQRNRNEGRSLYEKAIGHVIPFATLG